MSLKDYAVKYDKFQLNEKAAGLFPSFPCPYCQHRETSAVEPPCRECGHNVYSDFDDESEVDNDTDN